MGGGSSSLPVPENNRLLAPSAPTATAAAPTAAAAVAARAALTTRPLAAEPLAAWATGSIAAGTTRAARTARSVAEAGSAAGAVDTRAGGEAGRAILTRGLRRRDVLLVVHAFRHWRVQRESAARPAEQPEEDSTAPSGQPDRPCGATPARSATTGERSLFRRLTCILGGSR